MLNMSKQLGYFMVTNKIPHTLGARFSMKF